MVAARHPVERLEPASTAMRTPAGGERISPMASLRRDESRETEHCALGAGQQILRTVFDTASHISWCYP